MFYLARADVDALERVHKLVVQEWVRKGSPGKPPTSDETAYVAFRLGLRTILTAPSSTDSAPPVTRRR